MTSWNTIVHNGPTLVGELSSESSTNVSVERTNASASNVATPGVGVTHRITDRNANGSMACCSVWRDDATVSSAPVATERSIPAHIGSARGSPLDSIRSRGSLAPSSRWIAHSITSDMDRPPRAAACSILVNAEEEFFWKNPAFVDDALFAARPAANACPRDSARFPSWQPPTGSHTIGSGQDERPNGSNTHTRPKAARGPAIASRMDTSLLVTTSAPGADVQAGIMMSRDFPAPEAAITARTSSKVNTTGTPLVASRASSSPTCSSGARRRWPVVRPGRVIAADSRARAGPADAVTTALSAKPLPRWRRRRRPYQANTKARYPPTTATSSTANVTPTTAPLAVSTPSIVNGCRRTNALIVRATSNSPKPSEVTHTASCHTTTIPTPNPTSDRFARTCHDTTEPARSCLPRTVLTSPPPTRQRRRPRLLRSSALLRSPGRGLPR